MPSGLFNHHIQENLTAFKLLSPKNVFLSKLHRLLLSHVPLRPMETVTIKMLSTLGHHSSEALPGRVLALRAQASPGPHSTQTQGGGTRPSPAGLYPGLCLL